MAVVLPSAAASSGRSGWIRLKERTKWQDTGKRFADCAAGKAKSFS
jgi:hypothetical protein